jgi:hypothetical protein
MDRAAIHWIFLGLLAAAAPACVSDDAAAPHQAANGASELAPSSEDYDEDLELRFDDDWQQALDAEIGRVENAAESFIEASSNLYDLLIAIEDDQLGKQTTPVDAALRQSVQRYGELVAAVERFRERLGQDDVKQALAATASGAREYRDVERLLDGFQKPAKAAGSYADVQGRLLSEALDHQGGAGDPVVAAIPSTQRDALELLDYLRRVSAELASLSGTVTNWVADARKGGHPRGLSVESLTH